MNLSTRTAAATGLAALSALTPLGFCFAVTIRVPLDQPAIGEALAASGRGDTVLVAPGTYTGPLNRELLAEGRTVLSELGPETTVIDCEEEGRAFNFGSLWSESAEIVGFTVRNGRPPFGDHDSGGGMCIAGEAVVRDCVFEDCNGVACGGGILCRY